MTHSSLYASWNIKVSIFWWDSIAHQPCQRNGVNEKLVMLSSIRAIPMPPEIKAPPPLLYLKRRSSTSMQTDDDFEMQKVGTMSRDFTCARRMISATREGRLSCSTRALNGESNGGVLSVDTYSFNLSTRGGEIPLYFPLRYTCKCVLSLNAKNGFSSIGDL